MPLLEALTLRFACDQTARSSMPNIGTEDDVIIYKGNPHLIQCGIFAGEPSEDSFVDDLSNVSMASLVIRKHNAKGTVLIEKVLDPDSVNGALTYGEWAAGTAAHVEFELSDVDTNQVVPSDKTLDIYGAINLSTPRGPITIGFFNGVIKDDGTGNPGEPTMPDYTSYSRAEIDTLLANIAPAQGLGNVTGPNGATANRIATFVGSSGQEIQDSGYSISDLALANAVVNLTADQNVAGIKTFSASPVVPDATALDSTGKAANTKFVTSAITAMANTINTTVATKQPSSTPGTALAALTLAADKMIYATSPSAMATTTLSSFARTLLDDADAATMRATLGVGSGSGDASTNTSTSVDSELVLFNSTSGKSLKRASGTGIVLATSGVASYLTNNSTNWNTAYSERNNWDGGTGGSFVAATARTSLGLVIGTNVQAYSANLSTIAMASATTSFGANLLAQSDAANARTYLGVGTGTGDASTDVTESVAGGLAVFANTTGKVFTTIATPTVRGLEKTVYISIRTDGVDGTGTAEDPFDGSTQSKFDELMSTFGDNYRIYLGPGTFETKGPYSWYIQTGWHVIGSGKTVTTVKLVYAGPNSNGNTNFHVFSPPDITTHGDDVLFRDLTVDCNYDALYATLTSATNFCIGAIEARSGVFENVRAIHAGAQAENFTLSLQAHGPVGGGATAPRFSKISGCEVTDVSTVSSADQITAICIAAGYFESSTIPAEDVLAYGGTAIIENCRVDGGAYGTSADHPINLGYQIGGFNCAIVSNCYARNVHHGYFHDTFPTFGLQVTDNVFEGVSIGVLLNGGGNNINAYGIIARNVVTAFDSGFGINDGHDMTVEYNVLRPVPGCTLTTALIFQNRNADEAVDTSNNVYRYNRIHGDYSHAQVNMGAYYGEAPTGSPLVYGNRYFDGSDIEMVMDNCFPFNGPSFEYAGTATFHGTSNDGTSGIAFFKSLDETYALKLDLGLVRATSTGANAYLRLQAQGIGTVIFGNGDDTYVDDVGQLYARGLRLNGNDTTNTIYSSAGNIGITAGGTPKGLHVSSSTGNVTFDTSVIATTSVLSPIVDINSTGSSKPLSVKSASNDQTVASVVFQSNDQSHALNFSHGIIFATSTGADAYLRLQAQGVGRIIFGALENTYVDPDGLLYANSLRINGADTTNTLYQQTGDLGLTVGGTAKGLHLTNATGAALFDSTVQATGGYKSSDGTAGATDTQGGLVFKNGLYTSGSITSYQPLDSNLTSWAAITRASGFDTFVATPSSANLASLVIDETGSGALVFGTSPTLTTPKIASGGYIADANGNEQLIFTTTASAVNEFTLANAATGGRPTISATGGDTNVSISIKPKGASALVVGPSAPTVSATDGGALEITSNDTQARLMFTQGGGNKGWINGVSGGLQIRAAGSGFLELATGSGGFVEINNATTGTYRDLKLRLATHQYDSLGTTPTDALQVTNTTAAAAGAQQYSPSIRWTGQGWKTTSTAASQAVDFRAYVVPVQGTSAPTGNWTLESSINGGAFSNGLTFSSSGTLTLPTINVTGSGQSISTGGFGAIYSGIFDVGNTGKIEFSDGSNFNRAIMATSSTLQITNGSAGQWFPLSLGNRDSGTTTVTNGLTIGHQSTGTPAAGLGSGILFNINSSTTADQNAAQIASLWSDATHASRTARFVVSTVFNAGALTETFSVSQIAAGDAIARFGGTSSSFPALKRSSATLQVRLADDSAYADFAAAKITLNGVLKLKSYPAASPPSPDEGGLIWLPDEAGGPVVAYSDGSQWLRIDNNTLVSAA